MNPAILNEDRIPLDLPWCLQSFTIYYFKLGLFRIPHYFELIVLTIHLKSTLLFQTSVSKTEYKKKLPSDQRRVSSVKQLRLSHCSLFAVEGAEILGQTSQLFFTIDKSIRNDQKQQNIQRSFSVQQHLLIYLTYNILLLYFYLISVFLHTVQSVFFLKNDSLLRVLCLPSYFKTLLFQTFFSISLGTLK